MNEWEVIKLIRGLPIVHLHTSSEKEIFQDPQALRNHLVANQLDPEHTVCQRIDFNRTSTLTQQPDYILQIISLASGRAISITGDEIWQIEVERGHLSPERRDEIVSLLGVEAQLWLAVVDQLNQEVAVQLDKYKGQAVYLWSLEGESEGRMPGWGWKLQIHFEDPGCPGGVRHITIGSGQHLSRFLAQHLRQWLQEVAVKVPGKHPPRVDLQINV